MQKVRLILIVILASLLFSGCGKNSEDLDKVDDNLRKMVDDLENKTEKQLEGSGILTWDQKAEKKITTWNVMTWTMPQVIDINEVYASPGWNFMLKAKVTVEDGVITDIDVLSEENGSQKAFKKWAKWVVVWKQLSWLQIDTISGASLVTKAFNKAIKEVNK